MARIQSQQTCRASMNDHHVHHLWENHQTANRNVSFPSLQTFLYLHSLSPPTLLGLISWCTFEHSHQGVPLKCKSAVRVHANTHHACLDHRLLSRCARAVYCVDDHWCCHAQAGDGVGGNVGWWEDGDLPPKRRAGAGAGSAPHPPAPPQSPGQPPQPSLQREGEIMERGAKKE